MGRPFHGLDKRHTRLNMNVWSVHMWNVLFHTRLHNPSRYIPRQWNTIEQPCHAENLGILRSIHVLTITANVGAFPHFYWRFQTIKVEFWVENQELTSFPSFVSLLNTSKTTFRDRCRWYPVIWSWVKGILGWWMVGCFYHSLGSVLWCGRGLFVATSFWKMKARFRGSKARIRGWVSTSNLEFEVEAWPQTSNSSFWEHAIPRIPI